MVEDKTTTSKRFLNQNFLRFRRVNSKFKSFIDKVQKSSPPFKTTLYLNIRFKNIKERLEF